MSRGADTVRRAKAARVDRKRREVAPEEEEIFVSMCESLAALHHAGNIALIIAKLQDLGAFLNGFESINDTVRNTISTIFPVLAELLLSENPMVVKCTLICLLEITYLWQREFPAQLVESVVKVAPFQRGAPLELIFQVMRNIGMPILRLVSLEDLAKLSQTDQFAGTNELSGMLYDVTTRAELDPGLIPDLLWYIESCFTGRIEFTFKYNLWTIVNLIEQNLLDATAVSSVIAFLEFAIESCVPAYETPALIAIEKMCKNDLIPDDTVPIEKILECFGRWSSDETRTNSAVALTTILKKFPQFIRDVMDSDGYVWKTLVTSHSSSRISLKTNGLALVTAILNLVAPEVVLEIVEGGVFEMIADLIETPTALEAIVEIVEKLARHPSFPEVIAQMEEFVPREKIEEIAGEDNEASLIAQKLLSML